MVSPALNAFVDPKKGTTGNRIDCAMNHFGNAVVSDLQIAAVGGTAALIGKAGVKSAIAKAWTAAKQAGATTATIPLADLMGSKGNYLKKAKAVFEHIPTPVKVVAGALIGLSLLVRNYKKGKIEQKYLDRAQFVDHTYTLDNKEASISSPKNIKA